MLYSTTGSGESYTVDPDGCISNWVASQRDDGTWPDIDYASTRLSNWPTSFHTGRMALMATDYASPDSTHFRDKKLARSILKAWDWWTARDLQNPNWYPNKISVPGNLCAVALLLRDQMSPEQFEAGLKIMKRAKASSSGANLAELAMIQVAWGCLIGDSKVVAEAFGKVAADIKPRNADGLQPDHSFRYHGTQLYAGSYGSVYSMKAAFLMWLASGTAFEFPPDKTALFSASVLDGQRWMVYRKQMDPGAIGRSITIADAPSLVVQEKLRPGVSLMAKVKSGRQQELAGFAKELASGDSLLSGNRFYWNTLFMVHRRPGYYVSIRMCSDEVDNAEICNGEGFQTHNTADGVTVVKRTGDEYSGIFPVWDWHRIPGITADTSARLEGSPRYKGTAGFVGGVSDGDIGVAGFDLEKGGLSAKKAWFCFDKEVVCLGTDINCSGNNDVLTSVNQCNLVGEVSKVKSWVAHDGVGYIFPAGGQVVEKAGKQTGSWRSINGNLSDDPITKGVFSLWLDHGKSPKAASYQYILLPSVRPTDVPGYARKPAVAIVKNDKEVQAVRHTYLGITEAVFRAPGEVPLGDAGAISVDAPCLVILRNGTKQVTLTVAGVARSTEKQAIIHIKVPGKFTGEGCTKSGNFTSVVFELPQGALAGASITRVLRKV